MQEVRLSADGATFLEVGVLSDVGCVRANNEDSCGFFPGVDPDRGSLLVVADGMGGAAAGEVASGLAVDAISQRFFEPSAGPTPADAIRCAVESANEAIFSKAGEDPQLGGMGTTCSAAAIAGGELFFGHVGDSRIYLVANGELQQLTDDHSLAAEFERKSGATQAPARAKNVLTRCLGVKADVLVDGPTEPVILAPGSIIVICSDGLTNQVDDGEIQAITLRYPPDSACQRLVQLARERGAPDNVTVCIARVVGG